MKQQSTTERATRSGFDPEVLVELRDGLTPAQQSLLRECGAVEEALRGIEETREAEMENARLVREAFYPLSQQTRLVAVLRETQS